MMKYEKVRESMRKYDEIRESTMKYNEVCPSTKLSVLRLCENLTYHSKSVHQTRNFQTSFKTLCENFHTSFLTYGQMFINVS